MRRVLPLGLVLACAALPGLAGADVLRLNSPSTTSQVFAFKLKRGQLQRAYGAEIVVGRRTSMVSVGALQKATPGSGGVGTVRISAAGTVLRADGTAVRGGRRGPRRGAKAQSAQLKVKRDTVAPTAPTSLQGSASGSNISLSWGGSTDTGGSGLKGYQVTLIGTGVVASTSATSVTLTGAVAGKTYSYYVRAVDGAGNLSTASNTVSIVGGGVTTSPTGDTTPPSTPSLQASAGDGQVALSWSASSDASGIRGYQLYRGGSLLASPSGTSYTDSGLQNGTSYSYYVRAIDNAGNPSAASNTASAIPVASNTGGTTGPGTLVWSDEFTGTAGTLVSSTKWNAINWCDNWGSLSCNTSRSQNISLDGNGHLRITAIKENYTDPYGKTGSWTAARAESKYKFRYGTLQASIMIPAGRGLWPAFWGVTDKRADGTIGEYDVMEILGHEPDRSYCTSHGWPSGVHWQTASSYLWGSGLATGYHLYEMTWAPGSITYKLDGVTCAVHTPTTAGVGFWPFDTQGNIMLGLAVGGSWPGNPDAGTPTVAPMYVDWVRVYQ